MTDYYVRKNQAGASDSNPGTAADPFLTLAKAASVVSPGDKVYVGNGVYASTDAPDSQVNGTAANPITWEAEHGVLADATRTARGVVIQANWHPLSGYQLWRFFDWDSTIPYNVDLGDSASAHHLVREDCRYIRPWYNPTATISQANDAIQSHHLTFWNEYVWADYNTARLRDLARHTKSDTYSILWKGGESFYSTHDHVASLRGTGGDASDYNATKASRDASSRVLCEDWTFNGPKHPWGARGGAWGNFTVRCKFKSISTGDQKFSCSTNDYQDATYGSSGDLAAKDDAIRIWTGDSTHLFAEVFDSGSSEIDQRHGAVWCSSIDTGVDATDYDHYRQIATPPLFGQCTFTQNYGPTIVAQTSNNAGGGETHVLPVLSSCICDDNNKQGEGGTDSEWVDGDGTYTGTTPDACIFWVFNEGKSTFDTGGQVDGCLLGTSGNNIIRWKSGSNIFDLSEAQNNSNVPHAEWEFTANNSSGVMGFVDAANYDVSLLDTSDAIDNGRHQTTMADSGVSATSGELTLPRWVHDGMDCIGPTDFNDGSHPGLTVYLENTGGTATPIEIQTVDWYTTGSDNVTWDTPVTYNVGARVWVAQPDDNLNVDRGARQYQGGEAAPDVNPSPIVMVIR